MMKTLLDALRDEIHYPISDGHLENRLFKRGLMPNAICDVDVFNSPEFIGAVADSLFMLIAAPNFSEADENFNMVYKDLILKQANKLYNSIGESEKVLEDKPMVYIGG